MINSTFEEDSFCTNDLLENVCKAELEYQKSSYREIKVSNPLSVQQSNILLNTNSRLLENISPITKLTKSYSPKNSSPIVAEVGLCPSPGFHLTKRSDESSSKRIKGIHNFSTPRYSQRLINKQKLNKLLTSNDKEATKVDNSLEDISSVQYGKESSLCNIAQNKKNNSTNKENVLEIQENILEAPSKFKISNIHDCSIKIQSSKWLKKDSKPLIERGEIIQNPCEVSQLESPLKKEKEHSNSSSFLSSQDKLQLSSWGLPDDVLKKYEENGISKMFPWQVECLSLPGVLEGQNLIYSAPTSAGKTLVAEIILLKRVLEQGKKGIFILPFVSIAREKTFGLQRVFGAAGVRVEGFMGSKSPPGGFQKTDIAICTIEKANNIINRLIEDKRVDELGIIVVDELHMVGDSNRGYLLELLLTKLQYISASSKNGLEIQVVGMSATLPNLHVLAHWQNSQLYSTSYRPIPLVQMVKIGSVIYNEDFSVVKDLSSSELNVKGDGEHLIELCLETVLQGFSLLLFCPTKAWCEKIALSVASSFFSIGKPNSEYPGQVVEGLRRRLDGEALSKVIESLKTCPAGLDPVLQRSLGFGAAFHHAGLTLDERDIIEGAFRAGYLPVLVATSTLSSGVNLPARRVIIRSPNSGGRLMDPLVYKQMIGRAGRKGKDSHGESILMCASNERHKAELLVTSSLPPITSCLQRQDSLTGSMKRAVLEIVVSGAAKTAADIKRYWNCTLLAASMQDSAKKGEASESPESPESSASSDLAVEESILYLIDNELARCQESEGTKLLAATQLGSAILSAGLSPDEGIHVFTELQRARRCFVLENELHVVYQVTPVYVSGAWPNLDWMRFLEMWESLPQGLKKVAELVGVEESFIVRAMKGTVNCKVPRQKTLLAIHQRFYASLALLDLVHEVPLSNVVSKYGATKGLLQALQQSAATFAGMVTVFCNRLGWHNLELLIAQYQNRLEFGVQRDLCDLVRISLLNGQRARLLFDAGIEAVPQLANADHHAITSILLESGPFQSLKTNSSAFIIGPTGCPLSFAEASKLIVSEARSLMQKELGLENIDWNQKAVKKEAPKKEWSIKDLMAGPSSPVQENSEGNQEAPPPKLIPLQESGGERRTFKRSSPVTYQDWPTAKSPKMELKEESNPGGATGKKEEEREADIAVEERKEELSSAGCSSSIPDDVPRVARGGSPPNKSCGAKEKGKGKGSFLFAKPGAEEKGLEDRRSHSIYIPDSQEGLKGRREDTGGNAEGGASKRESDTTSCGVLSESLKKEFLSTILEEDSRWTLRSSKRDRTSIQSEDLFSMCSDGEEDEAEKSQMLSLRMEDDPSPLQAAGGVAPGCLEGVDPPLKELKKGKERNLKKAEPRTPMYSACSEEIDFGFDLTRTEGPKGAGRGGDDESFLTGTPTSQRPRPFCDASIPKMGSFDDSLPILSDSLVMTRDVTTRDLGDSIVLTGDVTTPKMGDFNDSVATPVDVTASMPGGGDSEDDSIVITESGVLSMTRDVIEKDLEEFESSLLTEKSDLGASLSDSFLNRAFESHLLREENGGKGGTGPEVSPFPPKTPRGNLDVFNDFSSIMLTPGIEAILQGKPPPPPLPAPRSPSPPLPAPPNPDVRTPNFRKSRTRAPKSKERRSPSSACPFVIESALDRSVRALRDSQPCEDEEGLCVIDVTSDEKLFEVFLQEWRSRESFALSLACERIQDQPARGGIGWRFCGRSLRTPAQRNPVAGLVVDQTKLLLTGMSISWGDTDAFYINLKTSQEVSADESVRDILFPTPWTSKTVSLQHRVSSIRNVLCDGLSGKNVQVWQVKETVKLLHRAGIGISNASFQDPRVAAWLIDPTANQKNIQEMVLNHIGDYSYLLENVGSAIGLESIGICDPSKGRKGSTRVRAATESVLVQHLTKALAQKLFELGLKESWDLIEMPSVYNLALMELNGMGFSHPECQEQKKMMQEKLELLEAEAFRLAGHTFCIGSQDEVSKVIYLELHLGAEAERAATRTRRSALKRGRRLVCGSTNKEAMEKLKDEHPLPKVILEWRKIKSALSKVVHPLSQQVVSCAPLCEDRCFPTCYTFTATGRVTFHEPNVQNIPKDFAIELPLRQPASRDSGSKNNVNPIMQQLSPLLDPLDAASTPTINLRQVIVAGKGRLLLAADYSQLELRLLGHLSGDTRLVDALNGGEDVFRSLAAQMYNLSEDRVESSMRQQAKQICYGIIYGMGEKTLGDQLGVSQKEAGEFMARFHQRFPSVRRFIQASLEEAKQKGYVVTMKGRRRFLPGLKSSVQADVAQSERQAVNTRIQGSAADLVKKALITIQERVRENFPRAPPSLTQSLHRGQSLCGAYFVLQLHDELIYEVADEDVIQVAQIVKEGMEEVEELQVRLPVKIKVGPSWGALQTLHL